MMRTAVVYGEALYGLAKDENLSHRIMQQLLALDGAFAQEPDYLRLLASANLTKAERCQIIDDSFRRELHPYVVNFLKILTEKGYIRQFSACCSVFRQCYNEGNGILPVSAVTAVALSAEQWEKLMQKLSKQTGRKVDLICRVDPKCLGGVRLDFNGQRFDGTVRHRLDDLRSILKNTVL